MTSGQQPPNSGAPVPVQGVTGGPPVLGGQISNDPTSGNVVISPNPGNVLQIRKGSTPQAFQVYEYFHTNTDFARVALNSQTNGPFQLQVETAPSTVIRELDINANGNVVINSGANTILRASSVIQFAPGGGGVIAQFQSSGLLPSATNAIDLGSPTNTWRQIFVGSLLYLGQVVPGGTANLTLSFDPAGGLNITNANLTAATAGAAPGVYLKVNISGAPYKIQLLSV